MKTADRTLMLFEAFAELGRPASLSELSRHLRIPVSSCFGLLRALERRNYVYAVKPRGTYYPTKRMLQVARAIAANDLLSARVSNVLQELRDTSGETVILATRRDLHVLYLDVYESSHKIRYVAQIGERRSLHASSLGKATLGMMTRGERAGLLARLPYNRLTPKTLTTAKALEADIVASQARGWYPNFGESVSDLYAIACPIVVDGDIYAVAIIGPKLRIETRCDRHVAQLTKACKAVSDPVRRVHPNKGTDLSRNRSKSKGGES